MPWSKAWDFISHLEVAISLLSGIPALVVPWAYKKWKRRLRTAATREPGYVRREARRGYRRPRTQPSRTYGAPLPENLPKAIRCCGRAPIEHYRHRLRIVAFWRAARLNLLPAKTIPKSAFTTADWRYEPMDCTDLAASDPYSAGFVLSLRLHCNENRWHLRRSLQATSLRARRLVVIASIRDMYQPTAWVRCLTVNADTLRLPKHAQGCAVVRVADPSASDGSIANRRRQKDVPDDAVWLIVAESDYRQPSPNWGRSPKQHAHQQTVPVRSGPQDCSDVDNDDYVRTWVASYRKVTALLWAVIGPGALLLGWAFLLLARLTQVSEILTEATVVFWSWYFVACFLAAVSASAELAAETIRARCWRRRENQARHDWKGGTDECLIVGDLLRRGPNLRPQQWAQHCAHIASHKEPVKPPAR